MQTIINTPKEPETLIPKNVQTPVSVSWGLFFIFLIVTIIYYFLSQPELPIYYTVGTKSDQLAPKIFLFLFPFISLIMNLIHFFIFRILQKYSALLLKLFVGTTITLQVLLGFALLRIIFITM